MSQIDGKYVRKQLKTLVERSRIVGSNVIHYTGPELGRLAESVGQRNIYGGYNWDTFVRNRSAKFTSILGSDKVKIQKPKPEQVENEKSLPLYLTRLFGGSYNGKEYEGHLNQIPIDLVHRVMGSGLDPDFTFNCYLMVSTKQRSNHHVSYMWGKMLRAIEPVPRAEDFYLLLVPDITTGIFGRFWAFPEQNLTIGVGCDYMGECKKGFLRMCMYSAKQKGIQGIHAGTKMVRAEDQTTGKLKDYGVAILGLSGTGKTTNVGHTHFLDKPDELSQVVQDDFVGLRLRDGRVLGTEQAMFLKTDLDEDDVLLRPVTRSPEFVSQNLYVDYKGEIQYLEEDLCANGRGILPLTSLPVERRYPEIDLPPLDEMDEMVFIFNTRRNTVVPIMQELSPEVAAAYFMLGESIETAAGDPTRVGQSVRCVGTNPFIVGDEAEEGNMFYEYIKRYEKKVRCFCMNTGGVGEIRDPNNPVTILNEANRPWKYGIGYITRAFFRNTAIWEDYSDFGTRVITGGVTDKNNKEFNMNKFDPRKIYDNDMRETLVKKLNQERIAYLEQFEGLDKKIIDAMKKTHLL